MKTMFTLTIFEILEGRRVLESRRVLGPAKWGTGSKSISLHSLLLYSELNKICGFIQILK